MVFRQRERACETIKSRRAQATLRRNFKRPNPRGVKQTGFSTGRPPRSQLSLQALSKISGLSYGNTTSANTPFRLLLIDQYSIDFKQQQRHKDRRSRLQASYIEALRGSPLTQPKFTPKLVIRICLELGPSDLASLACTTKLLFPAVMMSLWNVYHLQRFRPTPSLNKQNYGPVQGIPLPPPCQRIRQFVVHQPFDIFQRLRLLDLLPHCPKLEAVSFLFTEGGILEGRKFWTQIPRRLSQLGRRFTRLEVRVVEGPGLVGHLDLPFALASTKDIRVLRLDTVRAPALVLGPAEVAGEAVEPPPILLSSLYELELCLADAMELDIVQNLLEASGSLQVFVFTLPPTEDHVASALPPDLLMSLPQTLRVLHLINMPVDWTSLYYIRSLNRLAQFAFTPDTDVGIVDLVAYLYVTPAF